MQTFLLCHQKAINEVNESFQIYNRGAITEHWLLSATAISYLHKYFFLACMCNPFPVDGKQQICIHSNSQAISLQSVWLYWSWRQKIRWKPWVNTSCHIYQDEKFTQTFIQTVCIRIESCWGNKVEDKFWTSIMHFFDTIVFMSKECENIYCMIDHQWITQWGRKQKVVKTQEKRICRISHKGKSLFQYSRLSIC